MTDTFNRARVAILYYITAFSVNVYYGASGGLGVREESSFLSGYGDTESKVGDLVRLISAPESPFYLSWLLEIKPHENGYFTKYLLKSIDDGTLCWWSNVSLSSYDRKKVAANPQWKWTDKQFELNDRWLRACRKRDSYLVRPLYLDFKEDGSVAVGTRYHAILMGSYTLLEPMVLPNWKKVKFSDLLSCYDAANKHYESQKPVTK
jgi:hypothetical protein